jgi:hypothetical protein
MNLFYHHVGQTGAAEDFKKTIYSNVTYELVERNIPAHVPIRQEILDTIKAMFPSGTFNCWGVPSGAKSVIKNLKPGDVVLLIETTAGSGSIPALGIVRAYWDYELRELSRALWGNHKYPYIFFFETIRINLTWDDFVGHVGFKENYRPAGQFLSVRSDRLDAHGGLGGYLEFLLDEYSRDHRSPDLLDDLEKHRDSLGLLSPTEREAVIKSRIGQGIFRTDLITYWHGCSVTRCTTMPLLRASHIKPWRDSTNLERLDVYNGLLLIPNLDVAFDAGLISFRNSGQIMISDHLDRESREILGIADEMRLIRLEDNHRRYLTLHQQRIFRESR